MSTDSNKDKLFYKLIARQRTGSSTHQMTLMIDGRLITDTEELKHGLNISANSPHLMCIHGHTSKKMLKISEVLQTGTMITIPNKYSENAKSCKALVIMYINKFILFTFS